CDLHYPTTASRVHCLAQAQRRSPRVLRFESARCARYATRTVLSVLLASAANHAFFANGELMRSFTIPRPAFRVHCLAQAQAQRRSRRVLRFDSARCARYAQYERVVSVLLRLDKRERLFPFFSASAANHAFFAYPAHQPFAFTDLPVNRSHGP